MVFSCNAEVPFCPGKLSNRQTDGRRSCKFTSPAIFLVEPSWMEMAEGMILLYHWLQSHFDPRLEKPYDSHETSFSGGLATVAISRSAIVRLHTSVSTQDFQLLFSSFMCLCSKRNCCCWPSIASPAHHHTANERTSNGNRNSVSPADMQQ